MPINTKQLIELADIFIKKISNLDRDDEQKINWFSAHALLTLREENKNLLDRNKKLRKEIKSFKSKNVKYEINENDLFFDFLNYNQNSVINLRAKGKTLRECGLILSLSGNRISQIEFNAFRMLIEKGRFEECQHRFPEYFQKRLNILGERYPFILKISPDICDGSSIHSLNLSVRIYNCLKAENIHLIDDLLKISYNDLLKIPNLGKKSINELRHFLLTEGYQPIF